MLLSDSKIRQTRFKETRDSIEHMIGKIPISKYSKKYEHLLKGFNPSQRFDGPPAIFFSEHHPLTVAKFEYTSECDLGSSCFRSKYPRFPMILCPIDVNRVGSNISEGAHGFVEDLFINTYASVYVAPKWFPVSDETIIYSPSIYVHKDINTGEKLREDKFSVSISWLGLVESPEIVCDKNGHKYFKNKNDRDMMVHKINQFLQISSFSMNNVLIIPDLGDPVHDISQMFFNILKKYGHTFKKIVFCIADKNKRDVYINAWESQWKTTTPVII